MLILVCIILLELESVLILVCIILLELESVLILVCIILLVLDPQSALSSAAPTHLKSRFGLAVLVFSGTTHSFQEFQHKNAAVPLIFLLWTARVI